MSEQGLVAVDADVALRMIDLTDLQRRWITAFLNLWHLNERVPL